MPKPEQITEAAIDVAFAIISDIPLSEYTRTVLDYAKKAAQKQLKESNPDTNVAEFTAFSAGFSIGISEARVTIVAKRGIKLYIKTLFDKWKSQ